MQSAYTQYQQNGYLLIKNFFSEALMKEADRAIQSILSSQPLSEIAELEPKNSSMPRRIWLPTKRHDFFHQLVRHPEVLDYLEQLIGPNIFFHYSKLNMKGPKVGSPVAWHQDFSYYPHTNTDLVSCLIYLDDATKDNGCLQVIPESHRFGLLDHYIDGYFRGKVSDKIIASLPQRPVYLEAPAGSVIFLHCNVLHASATNHSTMQRRVFIPAYRAADAFPIYFGPHASHNEAHVELLRGKKSLFARQEAMTIKLPFAEKKFHSLYELQEGSHVSSKPEVIKGYYS